MTIETSPQSAELAAEFAAALQWWRDAGIDYDFSNNATDWLHAEDASPKVSAQTAGANTGEKPAPAAQSSAKPEQKSSPQRIDFFQGAPPKDLMEFRQWWLETPGLDPIGPRGRIAPRGPEQARLMVLIADPEEHDRDQLLSGRQGEFLSNILRASSISIDDVYFSSALPRHTPMADTAALASIGMDAVTLHHIGLVSPQRLVVMGTGLLPLIGQDVSDPERYLREINQNGGKLPVLLSEGFDSLMAMPRLKARFWRRWIEWTAQ